MSINDELSIDSKKRILYNLRLRRRRNLKLGGDFVCSRCQTPFGSHRALMFHLQGCERLTQAQLAWVMEDSEWSLSTLVKPQDKEWYEDPGIRPPPPTHQVPESVNRSITAARRKAQVTSWAGLVTEAQPGKTFQPTPEEIVSLIELILGMYR